MSRKYDHTKIEEKWRKRWQESGLYEVDLERAKNPFYNLMMFPYPSAEGLHVGNVYAFTGSDIYGRFKRMQRYSVFEPIGLDGFGIHSENYALKIGRHPVEQAKISEKNFYRQLGSIGNGFAWKNRLETYDSEYYKWTQWIFVQLFKKGLAYRAKAPVNWCPSCKTVLADEQVENKVKSQKSKSVCERCKTGVETRDLEQWFFRITKYADRLLNNLEKIDWTPKVKEMQKNWIGRKEGATVRFQISNFKFQIEVFTTRLDTLFGTTFLVLAPEHELCRKIMVQEQKAAVEKYIAEARRRRLNHEKEKTGVFTGAFAKNPASGEQIPIWIADYVSVEYGEGAVMGVPAHDQRDFEFAKKYDIPIRTVVGVDPRVDPDVTSGRTHGSAPTEAFSDDGVLVNSGKYSGLTSLEAQKRLLADGERGGWAQKKITYHLRDWLISRQRYWGPPIPIIYCRKCWEVQSSKFKVQSEEGRDYILMDKEKWAIVPVPEDSLPVELPYVEDWKPLGMGESPLATHEEWVEVACPKCGGAARRETDVSDTFLDSAWYFLRYPSVKAENSKLEILNSNDKNSKHLEIPWNREITQRWLPVTMYIGGAEHSVLHLLYSRFLTMVFHDWGLLDFEEPYKKFRAHGLLIKDGAKMSKSRGNVVVPDEHLKKYGADAFRLYLMFLGPFDQGGDFRDTGIAGMTRFLPRVWQIVGAHPQNHSVRGRHDAPVRGGGVKGNQQIMHKTIKKVTEDIENLKYNTAIAAIMEWVNEFKVQPRSRTPIPEQSSVRGTASSLRGKSSKFKIDREEARVLLKLLAPFAPFITEELWERLGGEFSIHQQPWPVYDKRLTREERVTIVVQVNGKVRDKLEVTRASSRGAIEQLALESDKVRKYLAGREVKRVVFVKDRLINFVS